MSISQADFEKSLAALDPSAGLDARGEARIAVDGLTVLIRFEAMPNRRLGGLLSLPQARVTLELRDGSEIQMRGFLYRFDIAFQRGGG